MRITDGGRDLIEAAGGTPPGSSQPSGVPRAFEIFVLEPAVGSLSGNGRRAAENG
jgi:hypothetical protein